MIQLEVKPKHRQPNPTPEERPSEDEPLIPLKTTVAVSLKSQLEKLSLNSEKDADEGNV